MPKKKQAGAAAGGQTSQDQAEPKSETAPNPFLDMWTKFADSYTKSNPFTNSFSNPFTASQNMGGFNQDWFKGYDEMAKQFYQMPMSGAAGNIFPKFIEAADTYMKLFKAWTDNAGNLSSSPDAMKNLLNMWMDSQKEVFGKLFGLPIPSMDNMGDFSESIKKSLENFSQFYDQNYKPFVENWSKLSSQMGDALKGKQDPAKYKELYNSLMQGYEAAFGKFLKMPMVGPSRQVLEKIHTSIDSFMKYCGATVEFSMLLYSPSKTTIEELTQKAQTILKGEATQEKYKQFYELLVKTFEDRFYQLFKTPAFAESLKTTLDSYLDFRNNHFAVVEEMLKSTPIITRTEINDVYQELYNLKKRIKELEKLLNAKKK
ncbi:MAG TPA: poly(R)-hydroxyalkanoic acid synthase subunit PhaE [Planctomycetota bacterium]|nr:poly(R)-hydroxyalkanoic acid synthase subunit PhaE [Planctomycetota bacterium]